MKKDLIIENIIKFILPLILVFGTYIQFNGESQSGGGFQAGMIIANGIILYGIIDPDRLKSLISERFINILMTLGVTLYGLVGFISIIKNGEFLNYYLLLGSKNDPLESQKLSINLVELGVFMTVCFVTLKIFYLFSAKDDNDNN